MVVETIQCQNCRFYIQGKEIGDFDITELLPDNANNQCPMCEGILSYKKEGDIPERSNREPSGEDISDDVNIEFKN